MRALDALGQTDVNLIVRSTKQTTKPSQDRCRSVAAPHLMGSELFAPCSRNLREGRYSEYPVQRLPCRSRPPAPMHGCDSCPDNRSDQAGLYFCGEAQMLGSIWAPQRDRSVKRTLPRSQAMKQARTTPLGEVNSRFLKLNRLPATLLHLLECEKGQREVNLRLV